MGNSSRGGFTLMEVLISMAILALISASIYQSIHQSFKIRVILQNEGEFYQGVRLAASILERDITNLFTPKNLLPPAGAPAGGPGSPPAPGSSVNPNATGTPLAVGEGNVIEQDFTAIAGQDASRVGRFWSKVIDRTGMRLSRFQGDSTKMSFVSLSHQRMYRDTPESEIVKVAYELRQNELDRARDKSIPEGSVLEKQVWTDAFALEERDSGSPVRKYPLLRGVKSLKFRYLNGKTGQFTDAWDSERIEFRHQIPSAIEVVLEVNGPEKLQFAGAFLYQPEILHEEVPVTF